MEKSHFFKFLNIKNYKCFKEFSVDNLERVNLIGGVNNIGKTAFLEACYLNCISTDLKSFILELKFIENQRNFINRLISLKMDRKNSFNIIDYFRDTSDYFKIETNIRIIKLKEYNNELDKLLEFSIDGDEKKKKISIKEFHETGFFPVMEKQINFISIINIDNRNLRSYFDKIQLNNKEKFLNDSINKFDKNMGVFKIETSTGTPKIFNNITKQYNNLSGFGEGVKRFITILCAIWASQNGQLFIDEIENGIHYTKFEKLWKIIFKTSKEANCQVFATTHSKECIEAFNKIQNKKNFPESKNTAYFEFARDVRNNSIFAAKRDKKQLNYDLENDMRFRGE